MYSIHTTYLIRYGPALRHLHYVEERNMSLSKHGSQGKGVDT